MNDPYVKLYKKLINWRWYRVQNTKSLFIHCLIKANWKDGYFKDILIKRGSFVTSRKHLAYELGMSEQEVRTALSNLQTTQEITSKSTNKYTIITVNNYDYYQPLNQQESENATTIEEEISNQIINKYTAGAREELFDYDWLGEEND